MTAPGSPPSSPGYANMATGARYPHSKAQYDTPAQAASYLLGVTDMRGAQRISMTIFGEATTPVRQKFWKRVIDTLQELNDAA